MLSWGCLYSTDEFHAFSFSEIRVPISSRPGSANTNPNYPGPKNEVSFEEPGEDFI